MKTFVAAWATVSAISGVYWRDPYMLGLAFFGFMWVRAARQGEAKT